MYTGTLIPVPIGEDGLYGPRRVPITGLIQARGLDLSGLQLEKEGGATSQNATPLPSAIVALFDWWPDAATQRTIAVTKGGGVYKDDGVSWTFATILAAEGTLTITQPPMLIAGGAEVPANNRKLFLLTGNDAVRVLSGDGAVLTILASPPTDFAGARQPGTGCIQQGRLVLLLGHNLYWSLATNHEDFTTAGSGTLPISPGEGERLTACVPMRGMLPLWKFPRGVYILNTTDPSSANWYYDTQSRAVGCPGPLAAIGVPNDAVFFDVELNVHVLSATDVAKDATSSDISTPKLSSWVRENLDASRGAWACLGWYGDRKQVYAGVSGLGALKNSRRLKIDFNAADLGPRFDWSDRDVCESIMLRRVSGIERPYIGTDTGVIYRLDQSARNKDGAGYFGGFQTDHTDLAELVPEWAGRRKAFDFLEFLLEGVGAYNLLVNVYIDGVLRTPSPLAFAMPGSGFILDLSQLDVDRLSSAALSRVRRRLTWTGTRISIEGFNGGVNETFKIVRVYVGARLAE
jgi:hypothetical protein